LTPILLAELVAAQPYRTALADHTGRTTVAELAERVRRWRALLATTGLSTGDTVALMLGNCREVYEAVLAGLHSGLRVVPVNWHLTAPEVGYLLADSGSRGLLVDPARVPVAAAAVARSPVPVRLVTGVVGRSGFRAVEPLLAATGPDATGPDATGSDAAGQECGELMLYTSGTTGEPKGVLNGLFRRGAPFARAGRLLDYSCRTLGVPRDGRVLLAGPWYHSAQLFFSLLPLLAGAGLVLTPRFDPAGVLDLIDEHGVTETHLVPTQFVRLLRLDPARRAGFSGRSLRRVWHGGGPCPPEVKAAMLDWWGPVLVEYYAATEGGVVTMIDAAQWRARPGSVGRAVPPNEVVIVGADGGPLPPGQPGRVFVRRPGTGFRYHNAPAKTRAAHLAPGTFTYGEVGYLDRDGYLFLTGRAQDLIVSGGVNVYPAEVEAVLLAHPAVADAAVLGVPDQEYGERVVAVVELAPGADKDTDAAGGTAPDAPGGDRDEALAGALDAHCRATLAGFKVPRAYRIVAALPREATGKVRKDALRAAYQHAPDTVAPVTAAPGGYR